MFTVIPPPRLDSASPEAENVFVRASSAASVGSNLGRILDPFAPPFPPLPSIDEDRSFHTAQEATDPIASPTPPPRRRTKGKLVVEQSDRVLRGNPQGTTRGEQYRANMAANKRPAAGVATGGPATKKARINSVASGAGHAASSSGAKKARKNTSRHLPTSTSISTSASSSKAAVAPPAEASLSQSAPSLPEASSAANIITNADSASTSESSRRASKRKAATMSGPATKKARITGAATSTVTRGATKAKASAEGKVTQASIGKGKKRAVDSDDDDDTAPPPPPKKARQIKGAKAPTPKVAINKAPTQRLDVFVCGEGSSGELGLGVATNAIDVKRPRLNPLLSASEVGVVHVATGGMHVAALTHDNLIYTWGVNDQGALGRETTWDGGMRDVDANDDEDQDTNGLNPRECTPTAIPRESFPPGVVFVQLACGDSNTFALTDDGDVYGWGTFRVSCHPRYLPTVHF